MRDEIRRNSDAGMPSIQPIPRRNKFAKVSLPKMEVLTEEEQFGRHMALQLSRHRQGVLGAREKAYSLMHESFSRPCES